MQKSHKVIISFINNPLAFLLGICISFVIYFINFSILGIGAFIILFIVLILLTILAILKESRIPKLKNLSVIFITHLSFITSLLVSFYFSDSYNINDIRYLLSTAINIAWLPLIYYFAKYQNNLFRYSFQIGFIFISYLIIFSWIFLAVKNMDLFFLRTGIKNIEILSLTIFDNPNLFSRITLIILVMVYFFVKTKRIKSNFAKKHLHFVILFLSFIVITALSRANIFALLLFISLTLTYEYFKHNKYNNNSFIVITIFLTLFIIILFAPKLHHRFLDATDKVTSFISTFSSDTNIESQSRRVRTWFATIKIIQQNPIVGVGFSKIKDNLLNFESIKRGKADFGEVILIHGGFLKISAYGGFLSLFSFIIFYLTMFIYSINSFFIKKMEINRCAAFCTIILLIILIPINIGADCFGLSLTWMSIAFLLTNSEIVRQSKPTLPDIIRLKICKLKN